MVLSQGKMKTCQNIQNEHCKWQEVQTYVLICYKLVVTSLISVFKTFQ